MFCIVCVCSMNIVPGTNGRIIDSKNYHSNPLDVLGNSVHPMGPVAMTWLLSLVDVVSEDDGRFKGCRCKQVWELM
jgi:hypothetical protein